MRRALLLVAVVMRVCVAGSPPTFAQAVAQSDSVSEAEAFSARAKELFKAKEFTRAAKLFMQAYALSHEPAQVYNAARAYEEAGMEGEAAGLFRLYISLTDDAEGILDARERIRKLEALQPVEVDPHAVEPVMGADTAQASAPVSTVPRWAATGGAVAALGSGVVLLLVGRAGTEAANQDLSSDPVAYKDANGTARKQWWAGAGLAGLGVGLTGLATWLWLEGTQRTIVIAPAPGGFCVSGRF
jgi:hypothetical protein